MSEHDRCECEEAEAAYIDVHPVQADALQVMSGLHMLTEESNRGKVVEDIMKYGISMWCIECKGHVDFWSEEDAEHIDGEPNYEESEGRPKFLEENKHGME